MASGGHGKSGMIWTILVTVFVLLILALVIFWLVTGGPSRAWQAGKNFTNPIAVIFGNGTTTGTLIHLPWQPAPVRGPDISSYVNTADEQQSAADTQSSDSGNAITRLQGYGNPSPYAGQVAITDNNATASDPAQEYVQIQASSDNGAPVNITGWSLQSAVSGRYAPIPQAAPIFVGGVVNNVSPVYLAPGALATITTAASPVGVSFEENICTGYLSQLQQFSPSLDQSCPSPSDALPQTAQNLRAYGASCFDYIANMPSCYFSGTSLPTSLTPACRSFIANNLSYNGCVAMYRNQTGFNLPSWRLYFALRSELWNNSHDIIRLLDSQGRVVDVLSY
jgi:flagellar basal body-associated protein FliL